MYYYDRSNDPFYDPRRRRAAEFYKKVLKHRYRQGANFKNARQAAIGLPIALRAGHGRDHVRNFIHAALADGTPIDDLVFLAEELERAMRQKFKSY